MTTLIVLIFLVLCFVVPTVRTYLQTKINPITFKNRDNAHDLIGIYMKISVFGILISSLAIDKLITLNISEYLLHSSLSFFGLALIFFSIIWITIAQINMGVTWRIGIDQQNKTNLTESGLFKYSRNPIYVGMISGLLGFYLHHSSFLNFFILIFSYVLISIQIRLEEEHLSTKHRDQYLEYKKRVPRWLFIK